MALEELYREVILDHYRNPDTQRGFAEKHKQKPAMVASYADGSKLAIESAILGNATGFTPAKRSASIAPAIASRNPTPSASARIDSLTPLLPRSSAASTTARSSSSSATLTLSRVSSVATRSAASLSGLVCSNPTQPTPSSASARSSHGRG